MFQGSNKKLVCRYRGEGKYISVKWVSEVDETSRVIDHDVVRRIEM
jgi:hypothetical protein